MNIIVLVFSEGFYHAMKVKHQQEEMHYSASDIYQSKSAYIIETINRDLGQNEFVRQVSL